MLFSIGSQVSLRVCQSRKVFDQVSELLQSVWGILAFLRFLILKVPAFPIVVRSVLKASAIVGKHEMSGKPYQTRDSLPFSELHVPKSCTYYQLWKLL
jgi:hypothetical protein